MGMFQQFLSDKKIELTTLARRSSQLEAHAEEDRLLAQKRWAKRRDKENQPKSYQDLGLGKPKSGRGVSPQQLQAALADQPLPPRVRGKIVRAVNALVTQAGGAPVSPGELFGDIKPRSGPKPKAS